jgi:CheY-like chemotaxis protein
MKLLKGSQNAKPSGAQPQQRILVVEDDDEIRGLCVRALLGFGYQVDTAADGAAGWEALQVGNHALLLTDHHMPKMSGLELVRKARLARLKLAVVLTSGAMPLHELDRQHWLHVTALLPKPFTPHELLAAVKEALDAPGHPGRFATATVRPLSTANRSPQSPPPLRWGLNE